MSFSSLRHRLVIWHAFWLAATFLAAGMLIYLGLRHYLEFNLAEATRHRAERIAMMAARLEGSSVEVLSKEISNDFAPEASGRFVRISRPDGSILYVSGPPADRSYDPGQIPPPPGRVGMRKVRQQDGGEMLIASVPSDTGQSPRFLVESGFSLTPALNELSRLLVSLAIGFSVVSVVALVGGLLLVGRALRPVVEMMRSAEGISSRNLSERLPVPTTGDELEQLTRSLNGMITRLEKSFHHNQIFMADASHELRTPLTILRTELEVMIRRPGIDHDLLVTLANLLEEVDRLIRIVETLFSLSRFEAGQAHGKHIRFDFSQLIASTAEQMCLLAEDKHQNITCDAPTPVWVAGDRARLKQVIVNLLDNAIKYTPPGGFVKIEVKEVGEEAVCDVVDNGVGISAEALPRIFDRFFRVDAEAIRSPAGAGIGLSIAKVICAAHDGYIEVESATGKGSRFSVHLPSAGAADASG